ncbi:MAG: glucose 1-dehydrogenase [Acidobacteria bacterium]|nr:MAG: glucose 1-dehydrogenase [Acidobacteriota bacterium]
MGYAGFDLTGRAAVVLGGTSGLGRVMALALAEAGADVAPASRRAAAVEAAAAEIEARGRRSLRAVADVTDRSSLERLRAAAERAFGAVDVLINCAGITRRQPTLEVAEDDWRAILEVNVTGTLRACQVFAPPMLERGWGRIVNVASIASFAGLYEVAAYTASKAAVAGLTRALAVEWGKRGVNVNAIAPGVFPTDLNRRLLDGTERGREFLARTPLGRFGRPEELGGAAVFLASEAASFVCGEILVVDGGLLASGVNR